MRIGRGDFATQCRGKTKYDTKAKAIDRIHHQMDDRRRLKHRSKSYKDTKLEPYKCAFCGHWHVGSSFNWETKWQREWELRVAKGIDRSLNHVGR